MDFYVSVMALSRIIAEDAYVQGLCSAGESIRKANGYSESVDDIKNEWKKRIDNRIIKYAEALGVTVNKEYPGNFLYQ